MAILLACIALLVCLGIGMFARFSTWGAMVRDNAGPVQARWALVLDGWVPGGERASKGMALVRAGQADSVLISGTRVAPGLWASTFQIRAQGSSFELKGRIGELRHGANSTLEEAQAATAFFRLHRIDTVLLVTSDYHSDRAASIFERIAGGKPVYLAVPAIESRFSAGWDRERLKTWLLESTKRLVWFGYERWSIEPYRPGRADSIEWAAALGDSAGASPMFDSRCPPPVVCPPAAPCAPPQEAAALPEPPDATPEKAAQTARPHVEEPAPKKLEPAAKPATAKKKTTPPKKAEPVKPGKKTTETKSSAKR